MYQIELDGNVELLSEEKLEELLKSMGVEFAHCRSVSGNQWVTFATPKNDGAMQPTHSNYECTTYGMGLRGLKKACRSIINPHTCDVMGLSESEAVKMVIETVLSCQPEVREALLMKKEQK